MLCFFIPLIKLNQMAGNFIIASLSEANRSHHETCIRYIIKLHVFFAKLGTLLDIVMGTEPHHRVPFHFFRVIEREF